MDFTLSYRTDYLQNVKSLRLFGDFVIQGQGLINWSLRTRTFLEDNNAGCQFPQPSSKAKFSLGPKQYEYSHVENGTVPVTLRTAHGTVPITLTTAHGTKVLHDMKRSRHSGMSICKWTNHNHNHTVHTVLHEYTWNAYEYSRHGICIRTAQLALYRLHAPMRGALMFVSQIFIFHNDVYISFSCYKRNMWMLTVRL